MVPASLRAAPLKTDLKTPELVLFGSQVTPSGAVPPSALPVREKL